MSPQEENRAGRAVSALLAGRGLPLAAFALVVATGCLFLFAIRERERVRELTGSREEMKAAVAGTRAQLADLTRRLNASVAAPAPAVVERNFYPFQIARSKQFQRTGPLGISLRKADPKHKRFDMVMLVDDAQLEKKRVNLFEPVLIRLADQSRPVELVVNRIGKDQIAGYVSELKADAAVKLSQR
jgi:hypothetical protein